MQKFKVGDYVKYSSGNDERAYKISRVMPNGKYHMMEYGKHFPAVPYKVVTEDQIIKA